MSVWQISDNLESSLQDIVRSSLDRTFKRLQRELENVRRREDFKERAVILCTWPVVGQQQGPGSLIIDVLLDYFQLDREKAVARYKRHHGFIIDHFSSASAPQHVQLLGWTCPGPSEQVLDQIAQIADNCTKPSWGLNFRSVFRATYTYVMYWDLGWESLPPLTKDRKKLWPFESDEGEGGWHVGESPVMHNPEQE
ncbi:hypothetical protein TI39_contig5918g00001 [Zymoseptoria brevis]|uniref:Uncharacterized protein n=1 Tax=Zymoseptoria brevis TaxID=1047168 RepID=A0A0F4G490_9PEZI|nr:hypothetical protein TI39_contig5918g00001 [Zymoseptoria brevis]